MNSTTRRVGRITVAVGLVGLGTALLLDNLLGTSPSYTSLVLRFWPVLLIGFGAEYLVFSLLDREQEGPAIRLRFDFAGAVLLFLLVGLTAGFHTLSTWISLNPRDYVLVGDRANRTESAALPAEGTKELVVQIDMGRVELYSQKLSEVRVEAEYGMHGLLQLRDQARAIDQFKLSMEGDETIRVTGDGPDRVNLGGMTAVYRIYAPADLKVRVETGAGSVTVRDYKGDLNLTAKVGMINVEAATGTLEAETSSGTIRVEDFAGPVTARTNAGSINVQRVNGPLSLDSGTGMIYVNEYSGGKLTAETRTGSINVDTGLPPEGDILLRTSTGAISLTLPPESSVKVSAQTKTGSISAPSVASVNQSGPSRSAAWTSGQGTYQVTLEANLGSINIHTP